MKEILVTNIDDWLETNREQFVPPVANRFLHKDGQLTVMFVSGPNSRCDFHVQAGEEFFYQMKGSVVLKIFIDGRHRDISINEGEIFLLPARVPHSPQRFKDTMGLVLERKRNLREFDILRFFVSTEKGLQSDILYETTFHWDNAATDMAKCLKEFSESEQCRTDLPKPGQKFNSSLTPNDCELRDPINLRQWISSNEATIRQKGRLEIYDTSTFKHKIFVYGTGVHQYLEAKAQTWLFQLEGESVLCLDDREILFQEHDGLLLETGVRCQISQQGERSYLLACCQHP